MATDLASDELSVEKARELDHAYCIEIWDRQRKVGIARPKDDN